MDQIAQMGNGSQPFYYSSQSPRADPSRNDDWMTKNSGPRGSKETVDSGEEKRTAEENLDFMKHFPTIAESSSSYERRTVNDRNTIPLRANPWQRDSRTLFGGRKERQNVELPNPYLDRTDPTWGQNLTDQELLEIFHQTGRAQKQLDLGNAKLLEWTQEDSRLLKIRRDQLCESAMILHLPDRFPMRDELEAWFEAGVGKKLQIRVIQLKLLGKQNWLLVTENKMQRDRVMQNTPLYWGGDVVEVLPWTPDFNPNKEMLNKVATWVELPLADAWLETLGDKFLQALGKPTFKTQNRGIYKYPNIRGCIMVPHDADLPEKLAAKLPDGSVILQEIKYQGAPNTCFRCKQTGHEARNCQEPAAFCKRTRLQKEQEEELAANPFHRLAGAFEVDMTVEAEEAELEPRAVRELQHTTSRLRKPISILEARRDQLEVEEKLRNELLHTATNADSNRAMEQLLAEKWWLELQRVKEQSNEAFKRQEKIIELPVAAVSLDGAGVNGSGEVQEGAIGGEPPLIEVETHWAKVEDESDHEHGDGELQRAKESNEETTEDLRKTVAVGEILVSETTELTRPEHNEVDEQEDQSPHPAKTEGSDGQDGSESPLKPSKGLVENVSGSGTSNGDEEDVQSAKVKGETSGSLAGHVATKEGHGTKESSDSKIVFSASKMQAELLAVGDSQRRTGVWTRLRNGRAGSELEGLATGSGEQDGAIDEDGDSLLSEDKLPETPTASLNKNGMNSGRRSMEDCEETPGHRSLTRPAEFSDSTPDRGNYNKKRVTQDPSAHPKQLLFSQELGPSWRDRILGSDAPQQQEVPDPNLVHEGGTTPKTCQALLQVTEVASGATGNEEGEDDTSQGSMEAEMSSRFNEEHKRK
ncbi:hypothetical protein R1sor_001152 [Riccia sorocarpa]|uniref:CCHC-type domain-containing protein n=1 Tax=Riccia sorocarpa TaxID=122646 RepID=A0ABD3GV53_9MARC